MSKEPVNRRRKRKRSQETRPYENQRRMWDTRWTPNTKELQELVGIAIRETGSALALSRAINMKYRHLRRVAHGESKAVSYRIVDQILARSSVAHRIRDLPWLTVEEMVDEGIWLPQKIFSPARSPK